MPRGLNNWTYKDVAKFLKSHGFRKSHELRGSHQVWINGAGDRIVNVNVIAAKKSYPNRTLETMIRQSGLTKKKWRS